MIVRIMNNFTTIFRRRILLFFFNLWEGYQLVLIYTYSFSNSMSIISSSKITRNPVGWESNIHNPLSFFIASEAMQSAVIFCSSYIWCTLTFNLWKWGCDTCLTCLVLWVDNFLHLITVFKWVLAHHKQSKAPPPQLYNNQYYTWNLKLIFPTQCAEFRLLQTWCYFASSNHSYLEQSIPLVEGSIRVVYLCNVCCPLQLHFWS